MKGKLYKHSVAVRYLRKDKNATSYFTGVYHNVHVFRLSVSEEGPVELICFIFKIFTYFYIEYKLT